MTRVIAYVLIAAVFMWMRIWASSSDHTSLEAVSSSKLADVSPLTLQKLSGSLKGDIEANLIRMKRTTYPIPSSKSDRVKAAIDQGPENTRSFEGTLPSGRNMAGTGADHHIHGVEYGLDLPPVCPRIQDHTDIMFRAGTKSMDPYGLPCLLEMHWSSEDAPSFDTVQCQRRYRLQGFTNWVCTGYPQLMSRYIMIYHIECLDIGPEGTILNKDFNPDLIINPAWLPIPTRHTSQDNDTVSTDTYEPRLEPGHYCYLRYAIEPNEMWNAAQMITIGVALIGGVFMIIGFVSSRSCAAIVTNVFYMFAVASITGISLFVIQFSDHLSNTALWWLPAGNVGIVGLLSICWIIPILTDTCDRRIFRREFDNGFPLRRIVQYKSGDEEECLLEDDYDSNHARGGPTFNMDYDALAQAIAIVNKGGAETRLRPRGRMKVALDTLETETLPTTELVETSKDVAIGEVSKEKEDENADAFKEC